MSKLIDCRVYLREVKEQCKEEIKKMGLNPHLAIIQVGNNPESDKYVGMKIKHCKEVGIEVSHYNPSHSNTEDLITLIKTLNNIINLIGGNGWSYMMLFSIESL